jgi:hypothetical protein
MRRSRIASAQPAISRTKLAGLAAHYGIDADDPAAAYFRLHAELDVEHARAAREALDAIFTALNDTTRFATTFTEETEDQAKQIDLVVRRMGELAGIDPRFSPHLESRKAVMGQVEDLALALRDYRESIDVSPDTGPSGT